MATANSGSPTASPGRRTSFAYVEMTLNVVGISAHYHDAACCILNQGRLIAAIQEERLSRVKHDPRLPTRAFVACLELAGMAIDDIDCIAYYEDPRMKLSRQLWMVIPRLSDVPESTLTRLDAGRPEREIRELLGFQGHLEFVEHHLSHAASSFFFSGFDHAATFTSDGVGEWATTTFGSARQCEVDLFEEIAFPHSLGLLYSSFTQYLGFEVNDAEYKVMGLAPYGQPRFVDEIWSVVERIDNGQLRLNMRFFDFLSGNQMHSKALCELLGEPPRQTHETLTQFHKDVAKSVQVVLEETLLDQIGYLYERVPSKNLCYAGGVALNCVANERLRKEGPFQNIFIQPAASDAGGALGAAAVAFTRLSRQRPTARMNHVFLGPQYSSDEIMALFSGSDVNVKDYRGDETGLLRATARRLANGGTVGWFQGRMEFGPRALGARSILADPRDPAMRARINAVIKQRETFRPFAPAVLDSKASEHFDLDHLSSFMLETCAVSSQLDLPSITHVDGSARVQTVDQLTNPRFFKLLEAFDELTGCPILLNTSFNMSGEPIVCTPTDALMCFLRSQLDTLILEDLVLDRESIPETWKSWFEGQASPITGVSSTIYTLL